MPITNDIFLQSFELTWESKVYQKKIEFFLKKKVPQGSMFLKKCSRQNCIIRECEYIKNYSTFNFGKRKSYEIKDIE